MICVLLLLRSLKLSRSDKGDEIVNPCRIAAAQYRLCITPIHALHPYMYHTHTSITPVHKVVTD